MPKLKVLNIIESMGNGGAQRIVLNYLIDFKNDKDIDFKVVVGNSSNDKYYADRIVKREKLNVQYLSIKSSIIKIPYIKRFFNKRIARKEWEKAIQEYKPDIIHVHISQLLHTTLKPIIKCNVPIRFDTLHSNPLRYRGKELKIIRQAFQKENFIPICVTQEQANVAKSYYGFKKYEIVRNGINFEDINNKTISKIEARKMYNVSEDSFLIIGVGRLNKIKRFDILIDAFKELSKKNNKAILIIAGEGPERKNLQKRIEQYQMTEKIRLIGNVADIVPLYCAADIMGITSTSESASLTLLEAQICGLRCVISDGVPSESIITNKVKKMKKKSTIIQWAEALQDTNFKGNAICMQDDYEVHSLSKKMKEIYLKYWKEYNNGQ